MTDAIGSAPEPMTGARLLLMGFALAAANFVVVLDMTVANVSVPHIAGGLAISPTQGTWVITSYAVADAISVPLTGWLASRFGTVRWLVASLFSFAVFSALCGASHTLTALIIFRICQGFAGGPLMPLTQTLLLKIFPKRLAGAAMGIWAITTVCAPIFGPIIGGALSDGWGWQWIFYINLPVIALILVIVTRIPGRFETPISRAPIDRIGLGLLIIWVAAFQLMLDNGRENDWFASSFVSAMGLVAMIGLPAFILWELGEKNPIVDIRVFRHRGFSAATISLAVAYGAFFASNVLTPLWLQSVIGYTATDAGYVMAFIGIFAVLFSPIAGRLVGVGDTRISVGSAIAWFAVVTLLRTQWTADADFWTLAIPQLIQGVGMPFFFIGLTAVALSSVRPEEVTSSAGSMSFIRTLSGAVGTAMATSAWDRATRISRSDMVPALNDPNATMALLEARGLSHEQARATIERLVDVQANTVGASHTYVYIAILFVVGAAAVVFIPKPKTVASGMASH